MTVLNYIRRVWEKKKSSRLLLWRWWI